MSDQEYSLYRRINNTIAKYSDELGDINDGEFVSALAAVLADFMTPASPKDRAGVREFFDRCVAEKIALNFEHETGERPHGLHS